MGDQVVSGFIKLEEETNNGIFMYVKIYKIFNLKPLEIQWIVKCCFKKEWETESQWLLMALLSILEL